MNYGNGFEEIISNIIGEFYVDDSEPCTLKIKESVSVMNRK
ncbi:MAG: hypothetical protein DF168_00270 [Candidatus Moanabacter tarae]|uniref:Uncharacterized protein n=1 Tax=Candidatus Moanibacter tarae TaxID=2200854 RepID=A0A2Z4AB33_9BACT|nr:MAG: hypothetical protein DF168_00270 [Candidatus Moanabacter tarae]